MIRLDALVDPSHLINGRDYVFEQYVPVKNGWLFSYSEDTEKGVMINAFQSDNSFTLSGSLVWIERDSKGSLTGFDPRIGEMTEKEKQVIIKAVAHLAKTLPAHSNIDYAASISNLLN